MLLVLGVVALVVTAILYTGSYKSWVPVTLTSGRSGLVMETGAKVMMNGVQVGEVASIASGPDAVSMALNIDPSRVRYIPSNVDAQIRATTAFGAKYVDLIYPDAPNPEPLAAGAVLRSRNVSTEVNTVFQTLVNLIHKVDPAKLNSALAAISQGVAGQGEKIGQAITDANQTLLQLNPRADTVRQDWRSLAGFSDTYGAVADNLIAILDAASTTATTITSQSSALDTLLLNAAGLGRAGTQLLQASNDDFIDAVNTLQPTTALLFEYSPEIACTLMGTKWYLDNGGLQGNGGRNSYSSLADAAILFGDEPYHYPENLPIVAAKGGPGGKPGCGSLPDPTKMYPVRQLIADTGWGTGLDIRPNPGIGTDCWVDYLPVTRAIPEPPSRRHCLPGPAPGPVTAPGMPPYGAALYGPGGVPLWPGIPPAPEAPPVPVPGTPVAPGKIPPQPAPPAVFSAPPPPLQQPSPQPAPPAP
jgi:phospholipid/cholesterol/gamma-HCH transport system substrate-binding protein